MGGGWGGWGGGFLLRHRFSLALDQQDRGGGQGERLGGDGNALTAGPLSPATALLLGNWFSP